MTTDLNALHGPGLGAAAAGLRARREVRHVPARGTRVLVTRAHLTRGYIDNIATWLTLASCENGTLIFHQSYGSVIVFQLSD